jgi:hypothetical protein
VAAGEGAADVTRIYLVTVVPTRRLRGRTVAREAYEYSATEHTEPAASAQGHRAWAGVTFSFELSPIVIVTAVQPRLLVDLLASVTAIVGGGFTIAMLVDACVHSLRDAVEPRGAWLDRRPSLKLHAR